MANTSCFLTEAQVRYAIENTTSNAEAARFLHIGSGTWKKYASMYIDPESNVSLYEHQKIVGAHRRIILPVSRYRRKTSNYYVAKDMLEIFDNKHPSYALSTFKKRLIREGWLVERCAKCGFQHRREYDYEMPIRLTFKDGNKHNYAFENIEFLCMNCYFIHIGNPLGGDKKYVIDENTGELRPLRDDRKILKNQTIRTGPFYEARKAVVDAMKKAKLEAKAYTEN